MELFHSLTERSFVQQFIRLWKEHRESGFALLFWLWVVGVTFWIETVPVQSIPTLSQKQQFSQITFFDFQFRQTDKSKNQIEVSAPQASFQSAQEQFLIDHPSMQWKNSTSSEIYSASSTKGFFISELSESALPSAFRYLIFSGSAVVQSETIQFQSETMLFDNQNRLFLFPQPFEYYGQNIRYKDREKYYDPIKQELQPLKILVESNPALSRILQIGGQS